MSLAALETIDMCKQSQMNEPSDEYMWQEDLANSGWKGVLVEKSDSDAIRKGLVEHSQVANHAEKGARKEKILGEINDWVLVKTSGSTRKETHGESIEAYSEGSAIVHAKDRDMNMASGGLRFSGTESPP